MVAIGTETPHTVAVEFHKAHTVAGAKVVASVHAYEIPAIDSIACQLEIF